MQVTTPGISQGSVSGLYYTLRGGHSEVEEVGGWVGEDDPRLVVGVDDQLDAEAATVL